MDFLGRSIVNNYTNNLLSKQELNDFLYDIKNHIIILEENHKQLIELIKKINYLVSLCYGTLLSIIIYLVYFS
jgi:hypothetical protein